MACHVDVTFVSESDNEFGVEWVPDENARPKAFMGGGGGSFVGN